MYSRTPLQAMGCSIGARIHEEYKCTILSAGGSFVALCDAIVIYRYTLVVVGSGYSGWSLLYPLTMHTTASVLVPYNHVYNR